MTRSGTERNIKTYPHSMVHTLYPSVYVSGPQKRGLSRKSPVLKRAVPSKAEIETLSAIVDKLLRPYFERLRRSLRVTAEDLQWISD